MGDNTKEVSNISVDVVQGNGYIVRVDYVDTISQVYSDTRRICLTAEGVVEFIRYTLEQNPLKVA